MKNGLGREARFNRYFEGYQKRVVIDRNGEEQIKYVYVLDHHRPELSEKAFIVRKIVNVCLFLVSAAAQLLAGLQQNIYMNHVKYMGFAQCLGLLAMVLIAVYICFHIAAPHTMEIRSFKNAHEKFCIATLISAIGLGAVFIAALVTMIVYKSFSLLSFIWLILYFIAAAAVFAIWFLEKKTSYERIPAN